MTVSLTEEQLQSIMPEAKPENIHLYYPALIEVLPEYGIDTPLRQAHFIAQIAHESGSFKYRAENLNYSAKALRAVFGKYFTDEQQAIDYARQPEKIANRVYANRLGNGDEQSGEGWKYRGRGLILITGKSNYETCGKAIELDLVDNPDQVADSAGVAVAAACWFWNSRYLNKYADKDDIKAITKRINGGLHGLEERQSYLDRAKEILIL